MHSAAGQSAKLHTMRDPAYHGLPLSLRILTHNIRYAAPPDQRFKDEQSWSERKHGLIAELLYNTRHCLSSVICLQEVLHHQLLDILHGLNGLGVSGDEQEWSYVGVGRDDGETAGEYAVILYRQRSWVVTSFETIWLSETPHMPGSKGWDAASVRVLSIAIMQHQDTAKIIAALNTHLDDQGPTSREMSARLIVEQARKIANASSIDFLFLAGDLNSEADGGAYKILNMTGSEMVDASPLIGEDGVDVRWYGNRDTFTGFNGRGDGEGRVTRIDFIHLGTHITNAESEFGTVERSDNSTIASRMLTWNVEGYAVLPSAFQDTSRISDHRAVVVDVSIWCYEG